MRQFSVPTINFDAHNYYGMINWDDNVTEPPLTKNISTSRILGAIESKVFNIEILFENIPCHTQAVERNIKAVTEVSSRVCGQTERDGTIQTMLTSRKKMPKFNFKCQFKV